ncbi:MAG TPA: hypothetical protein VMF89_24470, partial [Polyangiales bacterium]|nr:hypothetical protein [Polyangiales bacterium]
FVNPQYQRYNKLRASGLSMEQAIVEPLSEAERDAWQARWSQLGMCTDYLIISADKPVVRS